jgi:lipid-binding SYLF domain-containing protein
MKTVLGVFVIASVGALGCGHAPTKLGAQADLRTDSQNTLAQMEARDPGLRPLLDQSLAYIVFPSVGEGGFIFGGGGGNGVLYEFGQPSGFVELRHGAFGALIGGQGYSQLVVIRDTQALESLKHGRYDFGAGASAVIVRSGAASTATFEHGVVVFIHPTRGAMVNASLTGQRIRQVL